MCNRFEETSAVLLAAHLRQSGLDPTAHTTTPMLSWAGGCVACGCCPQHPGVNKYGQPMLSVVSKLSGKRLHREALILGLIKPMSSRDQRWLDRFEEAVRRDYNEGVQAGE